MKVFFFNVPQTQFMLLLFLFKCIWILKAKEMWALFG